MAVNLIFLVKQLTSKKFHNSSLDRIKRRCLGARARPREIDITNSSAVMWFRLRNRPVVHQGLSQSEINHKMALGPIGVSSIFSV